VVHARWMVRHYDMEKYAFVDIPHNPEVFETRDGVMYCSDCQGDALCNGREEQLPSRRCPHCGAFMDADAPERADHFVDVTEKVRKE